MKKSSNSSTDDLAGLQRTPSNRGGATDSPSLPSSMDMGAVVKRGILLKRGRNSLYHPWYLRTIVITDKNKLLYYDNDKLKGMVSLIGCTIRMIPPNEIGGKPYGFEIAGIGQQKTSQENRLILVAGSENEVLEWMEALETAHRLYASTVKTTYEYESLGDMVSKQKKQPGIYETAKAPVPTKAVGAKLEEDDDDDDDWDDIYFDSEAQDNDG